MHRAPFLRSRRDQGAQRGGVTVQLNHVHLGARDVAATQAFYENYCGFVKRADHGAGVFLDGDAGFLIAIDPVG